MEQFILQTHSSKNCLIVDVVQWTLSNTDVSSANWFNSSITIHVKSPNPNIAL